VLAQPVWPGAFDFLYVDVQSDGLEIVGEGLHGIAGHGGGPCEGEGTLFFGAGFKKGACAVGVVRNARNIVCWGVGGGHMRERLVVSVGLVREACAVDGLEQCATCVEGIPRRLIEWKR